MILSKNILLFFLIFNNSNSLSIQQKFDLVPGGCEIPYKNSKRHCNKNYVWISIDYAFVPGNNVGSVNSLDIEYAKNECINKTDCFSIDLDNVYCALNGYSLEYSKGQSFEILYALACCKEMNTLLSEDSIKKLDLIDRCREMFSAEENQKLTLPQIIAVGDQSSGKSSILEAISGVKLPKGCNTVTKCPLIIQMRTSNVKKTRIKYRDVEEIIQDSDTESEIIKIQTQVFKDQLTKEPITLIIESPTVMTLTVIDLPGIIKTVTTGLSAESKEKTMEIAKFYMKQENSLILCVLPTNQDICTTTTIALAKECNRDKSRIIGVLTKIDKLDLKEAQTLPDILKNVKLPINKGYYGLIVGDEFLNLPERQREQYEIGYIDKLSLTGHKQRLGLKNFTGALQKELSLLIDKSLPILKKNIDSFINETETDLEKFSVCYGDTGSQRQYIFKTVSDIEKKTNSIIAVGDGHIQQFIAMKSFLENEDNLKPINEDRTFLSVWNKIFEELYEKFNITFKDYFLMSKSKYRDPLKLEEYIKNVQTERNSMFDNSKPFKIIVDKVLNDFEDLSTKCLDKCCIILEQVIENVLVADIDERFYTMKIDIKDRSSELLKEQKLRTLEKLNFLFESEKLYFIQNKIVKSFRKKSEVDFSDNIVPNISKLQNSNSESHLVQRAMTPMTNNLIPKQGFSNGISEVNPQYESGKKLKENLENYLNNVIQRLGDVVPNFIMLSMFVHYSKLLHNELLKLLISDEKLSVYFSVSNNEKIKRGNLMKRLESLKIVKRELNEVCHSTKIN